MGALSIIPMPAANPSRSKDNITGTMPKPLALLALRHYAPSPQRWDVRKGSSSQGCILVVESSYLSTIFLRGQTASEIQLYPLPREPVWSETMYPVSFSLVSNAPFLQTTAESAFWGGTAECLLEGHNRGCCPKRELHPAAMSAL